MEYKEFKVGTKKNWAGIGSVLRLSKKRVTLQPSVLLRKTLRVNRLKLRSDARNSSHTKKAVG